MKKNKKTKQYVCWLLSFMIVTMSAVTATAMPGPGAQTPPEPQRMKSDHAPTPFTADQIRSACPFGRKLVFQVEALGQAAYFQTIVFGTGDNDGTVYNTVTQGVDGRQIGTKTYVIAKWKEIQAESSFPAAETEIKNEKYSTPAGDFDCLLYIVRSEKNGQKYEKRLYYAKTLPGPAVCTEEWVDGRMIYRMFLVKHKL